MGAGLCCGMSGLAAGVAIGVAGDAGVRAVAKQGKMYVGMVLILIFAEAAAPSRALCPSRRLHAASVPPTTSPAAATAPPGAARAARANPAPPGPLSAFGQPTPPPASNLRTGAGPVRPHHWADYDLEKLRGVRCWTCRVTVAAGDAAAPGPSPRSRLFVFPRGNTHEAPTFASLPPCQSRPRLRAGLVRLRERG